MGPQQSQDSDQSSLLDKGTVQYKGFYSMYFLVQKKDSGLQLILNLGRAELVYECKNVVKCNSWQAIIGHWWILVMPISMFLSL